MKFDTKVTFIFLKDPDGNTGWAVSKSSFDLIEMEIGPTTFTGPFVKLKEWCDSRGIQMTLETLEYTFSAAFDAGKFDDVEYGCQFRRESCGQRMIRTPVGEGGMNAVCLHGAHAGSRYKVSPDEEVRFINSNKPVEV